MVEMRVDERKAVVEGDNVVLIAHQEQVYSKEAYANMLAEWQKELKTKRDWLKDYDKHLAAARKSMTEQLEAMRKQLEIDAKNLAKGIKELSAPEGK
jgi:vacuolar-type H+-ATPase subunit I/STV1